MDHKFSNLKVFYLKSDFCLHLSSDIIEILLKSLQKLEVFICDAKIWKTTKYSGNLFKYISPNIKIISADSFILNPSALLSMAENDLQLSEIGFYVTSNVFQHFSKAMSLIGQRFKGLKNFYCLGFQFEYQSIPLQNQFFKDLSKLINLEEIHLVLDFNAITEQQIESFRNCGKLRKFCFDNQLMTDQLLKSFLNVCKHLTTIYVFNDLITIQSKATSIEFANQRPDVLIEITFKEYLRQEFQNSIQRIPQNLKFLFSN